MVSGVRIPDSPPVGGLIKTALDFASKANGTLIGMGIDTSALRHILGETMCEYCYCDRRTEEGFIGEQIGGDHDHPVFITKLDNPIDNYLF